MGQIVGLNAKLKRANLNALSLVPTPANGEIILVSSDSSMTADGQGNFDCYIEGDGTTSALSLPRKKITSIQDVDGLKLIIDAAEGKNTEVNVDTTWEKGSTLNSNGSLVSDNDAIRTNYIDVASIEYFTLGVELLPTGYTYRVKPTWYNANKGLLATPVWSTQGTVEVEYDRPDNAAFVIFVIDMYNGSTKVSLNASNDYEAYIRGLSPTAWDGLLEKVNSFPEQMKELSAELNSKLIPIENKIAEAEGNIPIIPFSTTWESGSTRNSDGALVTDTKMLRTDYVDVSGKTAMNFSADNLPEGLTFSIKPTFYTENKILVETPTWSAKSVQSIDFSIPSGVTYVIVVVALYDANNIQQTLSASSATTYGFIAGINQEPSDWYNLLEKVQDIDAISTKIAEAEGYVNPMQGVTYVQGSTNNTTGADAADNNTIRSNYIEVNSIDMLYLSAYAMPEGSTLMIKPTWYNSNQELLETPVWSAEGLSFDIPVPSGAASLRLVIGKRINSKYVNLTPYNVPEYKINLGTGDSDWFRLLQREDNVDETVNDNARKSNPYSIKVASYNIGHFAHGASQNSNITSANYTAALANYRNLVNNELNADLIGLCEYSAVFGKNTDNVDVLAKDVLFTRYGFQFANFLQSRYSCNALYSRVYIDNVNRQIFECNQTAVITHTTAIEATDYYYIEADLWMAGKLVKLVMTHLAFDNNNPQVVADQISELITKFSNTDRIVLMGDWNVSSFEQFTPFVTAGYTLGNDGTMMTYSDTNPNRALDNIIVKGLDISNVGVVQTSGLSDHCPIFGLISL